MNYINVFNNFKNYFHSNTSYFIAFFDMMGVDIVGIDILFV